MARGLLGRLVISLCLAAAACFPERPAVLYGPDQPLTSDAYPSVLRTWTRSARIYQVLDNKLFITATFHSPEFRRAFAVAFPDIYGHGGKITRRELVDLSGGVEQYHNFFLAIHTPDLRWNDLSKSDSIWHLTLRGSAEASVSAHEVVPIKTDENLKAVYPYMTRFDRAYLVRFPLTDPLHRSVVDATTTSFSMRIASALGSAEMTWVLWDPKKGDAPLEYQTPLSMVMEPELLQFPWFFTFPTINSQPEEPAGVAL